MTNLTVVIDDDVLKRARMRALDQGTSVNALLRDYLATYAGGSAARAAMKELVKLAKKSTSSSGPDGRTWTRESLHDR